MSDVTRILERAREGDAGAAESLFTLVYDELRQLAAVKLAHEKPGQTLQPTALVHEAWLRLGGDAPSTWQSRAHFFAAAGEAMRRILVESVRRKSRQKRGGGVDLVSFDDMEIQVPISAPQDEILAVHEALDRLASEEPAAAEVVKLRYFVGFPLSQAAEALQLSPRTATRLWTFARVRLRQLIRGERG